MSGGRRAHRAGSVGRWRGKGDASRPDKSASRFVRRRTYRDSVEARARQQADAAGRSRRQDQSERPRPERAGQHLGLRAKGGVLSRRLDVQDVGDERVDRWTLLGGVDRRNRGVGSRVRCEAVHSLSRHGDQASSAKARGRLGDRLRVCLGQAGDFAVERHLSFRFALRANSTVHKLFCPCRDNQLVQCLRPVWPRPIGPARSR